ncbi:MAG: Dna2/Cas4 domain-containing protein [Euryarchaeota archaeon]|nr:Dna2/Cas4 domain-containing protein [Euryarchaeota archaeon]
MKPRVQVKVSDLTRYLICPRLVYFNAKEHREGMVKGKERGFIESILLKELAFNLHKFYGARKEEDPEPEPEAETETEEERAKRIIEDIVDGVERIYKEELKGVEMDFFEEVKEDFIRRLSMSTKMENGDWLEKVRTENGLSELENAYGYEREHALLSENLSMSGSVDKLIRTEEEVIPCMIKTGKCPEYSVWKSDRVQLAAYAMLIEEEFGLETTVKRGFVEYIRNAEFRETQIRRRDRALALQILKRVKRIKGGVFPEKGGNAPCDKCVFAERCETRKTLLSTLFGK